MAKSDAIKAGTGKEVEGNSEQVGFHKGSLTTLAKERQELMRMLTIVEQLMQMHISELKNMGIDLEKEASKQAQKKPIEDIVRK